jgi:uncharacterized surface protein with fasciclin (FAS1) repeats
VQAADLAATLADPEAMLTVLAPVDSAFAMISTEDIAALLAVKPALIEVRFRSLRCDPTHLVLLCVACAMYTARLLIQLFCCTAIHAACCVQILNLHVIPGVYKAADFANLSEVETLGGAKLYVSVEGGKVTFTGPDGGTSATVTEADLMSCKGVVHKIDFLLVPGIPENKMIESIVPTPAPESVPMPEPMPAPAPAVVESVPEVPMPTSSPIRGVPAPMTLEEPEEIAPMEADVPAPGPGGDSFGDCPAILDLVLEAGDLDTLLQALDVRSPLVFHLNSICHKHPTCQLWPTITSWWFTVVSRSRQTANLPQIRFICELSFALLFSRLARGVLLYC